MYFSPKGSRLYLSLISRPKYIWYLLTISICLLLLSVWWIFLNKPINKIIKSQIANINNLKIEFDKTDLKFDAQDNFKNKKSLETKSLVRTLNQLKYEFKEKNSGTENIIKIIEQASKNGLNIQLYDFKPEIIKSWYTKYTFELDILGYFEAVIKFMEKISSQNLNLKFIDFIAKKTNNNLINVKMTIQMLDIKNEAY